MIVLRAPDAVNQVPQEEIRTLALRRFATLSEEDPYDPDVMGYFVVAEAGEPAAVISDQVGFDVLTNRFTGARFDEPGFTPSFEILEEHRACFEIVFVISDDGFGVEVFVPKLQGIDPDLLAMCAMHAVLSQEESEP